MLTYVSFDGGFDCRPGSEPHAGQIYRIPITIGQLNQVNSDSFVGELLNIVTLRWIQWTNTTVQYDFILACQMKKFCTLAINMVDSFCK